MPPDLKHEASLRNQRGFFIWAEVKISKFKKRGQELFHNQYSKKRRDVQKMRIISVRLNPQEEKVMKKLVDYYGEDRSKLLKRSLYELYENIIDGKEIEKYEKKESSKKTKFHSAEEILKAI